MCGRFTLVSKLELIQQLFQLHDPPPYPPRYNIAPSQPVLSVRHNPETGKRDWALLQWGLVPSWANDPSIGMKAINARSETVFEKPMFRQAIRRRRCLIPTDGFYEWKVEGKEKHPRLIRQSDARPFVFAGLWETWGKEDSRMESCTILTRDAIASLHEVHHRMPVVVQPDDFDTWLDPSNQDQDSLASILQNDPGERFSISPVSKRVNNARVDDASLWEEPAQHDLF